MDQSTSYRTYHSYLDKPGYTSILRFTFISLFFLTVIIHFAVSIFKGYAYYLNESLLYSSYWLMAIWPCSKLKYHKKDSTPSFLFLLFLHTTILLAACGFIWLIGETIMYHPYNLNNIIGYHLEMYGIPGIAVMLLLFRFGHQPQIKETKEEWVFLGNQKFRPSYITHIVADGHYLFIHGREGRKHHVRCTIKKAMSMLKDYNFIKIGRSVIIDPDTIQTFIKEKKHHYLVTIQGNKIKIPYDYKP